jgi:hypothetical protein
MLGLRSNFGPSLTLTAITVVVSFVVAAAVARRRQLSGRLWIEQAARVLAAGSVIAVIVATALPRRIGIETDGDIVLALGRAGLGEWRRFLDDPLSLASIQLAANVLLYVAVGFTMAVGWYRLRRRVLPICLALSVAIETTQFLVLGRVAALDDVLLNMAGAVLGYLAAGVVVRHGLRRRVSAIETRRPSPLSAQSIRAGVDRPAEHH